VKLSEIHGLPHRRPGLQKIQGDLLVRFGSTRGCVIMTDADIDDLAAITVFPVTVEILASRQERGLRPIPISKIVFHAHPTRAAMVNSELLSKLT